MRRTVWAAALSALALVCLTGGAGAESMTMMGLDTLSGRDWQTNVFFERMEARTGVAFTLEQFIDTAAYQTAKADVLAGGAEMPDVLFKADLTPTEELRGAQNGTLVDLSPLLAEHAPNLWALLEAHPDWREAVTLPDGKIVALPALYVPSQVCIWINTSWLDEGAEMPGTPQAFRDMLIAFRDGDPNGNGRRDEIPLLLTGPWEARWLMSFFGLAANDYNLYLDAGGAVRFAPLEPAFGEYLAYMRDLYAEGLLGTDAFRASHILMEQEDKENLGETIGGMIGPGPYTLLESPATERFAALQPIAYQGEVAYRDLLGPVWRGTFAITSACPDPAAALRWVDMLYTEEGAILAVAGEQGSEYAVTGDGMWDFVAGLEGPDPSIQPRALIEGSVITPGIRPDAFLKRNVNTEQKRLMEEQEMVTAVARMPLPLCYPTEAEQEEIDALQSVLGRMVDEGIARFVIGETPLDEEHLAAFQETLRQAGAQRLTQLWQNVVDGRWQANAN